MTFDQETARIGKRGSVVIPARLRRKYRLEEGSLVIAEATAEGLLLRPATALPVEIYTPERRAEFLLNNAVNATDYREAVRAVRDMGLDPATITHVKPGNPK